MQVFMQPFNIHKDFEKTQTDWKLKMFQYMFIIFFL